MTQPPPEHDIEEARVDGAEQPQMFPRTPEEYCQGLGLNWAMAESLFEWGCLSFNPATTPDMNERQAAELVFVGALVAAGCDRRFLETLLHTLRKPYRYRIEDVYYDWLEKRWRMLPGRDWESLKDVVSDLIESADRDALESAAERIQDALDDEGGR